MRPETKAVLKRFPLALGVLIIVEGVMTGSAFALLRHFHIALQNELRLLIFSCLNNLLLMPFLIFVLWPGFRRGKRVAEGRCTRCGYDLRASPDRCPECGADRRTNET